MIKLIEHGLFGNALVEVTSESMINRYNGCLKDIGLAPTNLKSFHVDGWGWSPEIAEEQGDRFYLSHGLANPYGIVISPEQAKGSIYMPYHSFDWDIHKMIYGEYFEQIREITMRSGLWFELDQEISAYRAPQDLLMIDYVKLNFFSVGRIMNAAKDQRSLIREFYDKPHAWANDELREKIIESAAKYGDLRYSKFDIPSHPFNDVSSFYTLAFNGIFVFKQPKDSKPLLIFQNDSSQVSGEQDHDHIEFNISDSGLIDYLLRTNMLSTDTAFFNDHRILLEITCENLLIEAANKLDSDLDIGNLSSPQKKGVVNRLVQDNLLSDDYFELERLVSHMSGGSPHRPSAPKALMPFLLHPSPDLDEYTKKVLWQLLVSINPHNPVLMYLFDKSNFYTQYQHRSEHLQTWIVNKVLEHKFIFNQLMQ